MKPAAPFKHFLLPALILLFTLFAGAQDAPVFYDLQQWQGEGKLTVFNRELSPISDTGRKGIRLSEKSGDGVVWLEGVTFTNGTVEVDIRGKDVLQKSFPGIAFHGVDEKTLNVVYFRPFNFRSADSVRRIHAVQYACHPDYPWNRLREERNAQYEKEVYPAPDPNGWFHVKLEVEYPRILVYVNGNARPSLSVEQLDGNCSGKIGFYVGNESGGDFANLVIRKK